MILNQFDSEATEADLNELNETIKGHQTFVRPSSGLEKSFFQTLRNSDSVDCC